MKINIGAGGFTKKGWSTLDFYEGSDYHMDLRNNDPLPFEDSSVEIFFTSHLIEHLSNDSDMFLFKEVYRCLKPGGVFRISCPDADKAFRAYEKRDTDWFMTSGVYTLGRNVEQHLVDFFASFSLDDRSEKSMHDTDQEIIKEKYKNLSAKDFIDWCQSLVPEKAVYRAHINGFNFGKLKSFLENAGFDGEKIERSTFRGSSIGELREEDFDNREKVSLFVEATK